MLVSIVIPAYNAESTLAQCLEACTRQNGAETEVIVVDDGSTDATRGIAESFPVSYVYQTNAGPAAARNHGTRVAEGEIVAFTDSDCVPAPDWVASLAAGFSDGVSAVGGSYSIANESRFLARMIHEEIAMRHAQFEEEVDFLGSFNVAYRKQDFEKVGGFDESFLSASGEDNDLAYRLSDAGGKLRFLGGAKVAHYHPTRLWPYLRTQARHGYWRMKLYVKHPDRAQGGDHYAGIVDLAAPALSLLALGCALLAALSLYGGVNAAWTVALSGAILAYALIRLPLPARMAARAHDTSLLLFWPVVLLRDVARALGMLRGIWEFMVRKGVHADGARAGNHSGV